MDRFTKSKKDIHPDYVTGGEEMGHGEIEQTEPKETEDDVRVVTIERMDGWKCVCKQSSEIPLTSNVL